MSAMSTFLSRATSHIITISKILMITSCYNNNNNNNSRGVKAESYSKSDQNQEI